MARIGRKRLTLDIPVALHGELKMITKRRNITMTRLLIRLIVSVIARERELE